VQLVPCAVVALISHPNTRHFFLNRVLWAFCVYVEAVAVGPQVVMMQHNKTVEKFTGHYVFFLGLSRFFSCAHWVLQMADGRSSALWQVRVLLARSCCHCAHLDDIGVGVLEREAAYKPHACHCAQTCALNRL
jgi:hypothetical protein